MIEIDYRTLPPNEKWRKAIHSLKPKAAWKSVDQVLTWLDSSQTEPTSSEITAEISRLETVAANEEYKRKRVKAYPDLGDQLDNLYKDILAGKVDATGEFAKAIKTVKDANPKP